MTSPAPRKGPRVPKPPKGYRRVPAGALILDSFKVWCECYPDWRPCLAVPGARVRKNSHSVYARKVSRPVSRARGKK